MANMDEIDDETLNQKMNEMKLWLADQADLIPDLSEKSLKLFLHSCMYDVEMAQRTVLAYFKLRIESPYYFTNRDPSNEYFQVLIKTAYAILLPGVTNEGYRIIMVGYLPENGNECVFKNCAKRLMMLIDMWLEKLDICPGYIVVLDCGNMTLSHYVSVSVDAVKKLCIYFQEALPLRLKSICFINISTAANMMLGMAQPFLSNRIKSMIHTYTKANRDYENLIPKRMLPTDIGGDFGSIAELHEAAQQELVNNKEWFREQDEMIKCLIEKWSTSENKSLLRKLF